MKSLGGMRLHEKVGVGVGRGERLKGHESEQTPGDSKGHGSLARCSPWGHRESNTT